MENFESIVVSLVLPAHGTRRPIRERAGDRRGACPGIGSWDRQGRGKHGRRVNLRQSDEMPVKENIAEGTALRAIDEACMFVMRVCAASMP
jgi:hypothetical protein